jgi:hypothetical protein
MSETGTDDYGDVGVDSAAGCCRCSWTTQDDTVGTTDPASLAEYGAGGPTAGTSVDVLDAEIDEARIRVAAASARLAQLATHDGDYRQSDVLAARRDKEAAEAELTSVESRRQRVVVGQLAREDAEEKAIFRAIMFWQHFTMYVLYFVCLMNIFITAFGIYGGQSTIPVTTTESTQP